MSKKSISLEELKTQLEQQLREAFLSDIGTIETEDFYLRTRQAMERWIEEQTDQPMVNVEVDGVEGNMIHFRIKMPNIINAIHVDEENDE